MDGKCSCPGLPARRWKKELSVRPSVHTVRLVSRGPTSPMFRCTPLGTDSSYSHNRHTHTHTHTLNLDPIASQSAGPHLLFLVVVNIFLL